MVKACTIYFTTCRCLRLEEALPVWRSTPEGTGADWNSPLEWASAAARRKLIGLVGAERPAAFIWSGGREGAWGIKCLH